MCTFAFIATDDGGYIVGHNRDESRARGHGEPPSRRIVRGRALIAPRDPDAGGTWIGVNDAGVTMCVLNAAEPEGRTLLEPLRSRGLVLSELLHLESTAAVEGTLCGDVDRLRSVRSFQLVVAEPGDGTRPANAVAMRWNGDNLLVEKVDPPAIRISSTHHLEEASLARQASWLNLLSSVPPRDQVSPSKSLCGISKVIPDPPGRLYLDRKTLANWLASHEPTQGPLSVCMHREEAHTVCRTIVHVDRATHRMSYHDGQPCEPGLEITLEL